MVLHAFLAKRNQVVSESPALPHRSDGERITLQEGVRIYGLVV